MKNKFFYYFLAFTWGLPMTLIGGCIALALLITGHKPHKYGGCIYFEVGNNWGGFSTGLTIVVNKNSSNYLKNHEFGHSFQNCWWGPLFPFIIGLPSMIRYYYRELKYYKKGKSPTTDYDSIWFEGQATKLGIKYISSWQ